MPSGFLRLAYLALTASLLASAQQQMTLQQAAERKLPDYAPAQEGKLVRVAGQVVSRPIATPNNEFLVSLRDRENYGLTLVGPPGKFDGLIPGDWLEVDGTIRKRHGAPVLEAGQMKRTSSEPVPAPKTVSLGALNGFRHLGLIVVTEGRVASIGENQGGDLIAITDGRNYLNVFIYRQKEPPPGWLSELQAGDRVRVRGLASQFCNTPPYNHFFELILPEATSLSELEDGGALPLWMWLVAFGGVAVVLGVWWLRESRMAQQRRNMRALNTLSEQIVAASSPAEILAKLQAVLPKVTNASGVRMYLYHRKTKMMERVTSAGDPASFSFPVDDPPAAVATAVSACFRNRSLLNIPDVKRTPLLRSMDTADLPRAMMFVPMFAQTELLGILQVDRSEGLRHFSPEAQAATQHLANQVATALKLQDQQTMREQLFRTEKLAATGQLISGVATELRAPLDSIVHLTEQARRRGGAAGLEGELNMLEAQARRASAIVTRLVSYASTDGAAVGPVDLNELMRSLISFRESEWQARELHFVDRLSPETIAVVGVQSQLEQVFLNLLVHAEQSAAEASDKAVTVTSGVIARRALVTFHYAAGSVDSEVDPFADGGALGLGVARGIIRSHGGELRFKSRGGALMFEIELPAPRGTPAEPSQNGAGIRKSARPLTLLVLDPEPETQRATVSALSARGHRVVPTANPEEAADLAQRMRFDAMVCPVLLKGRSSAQFLQVVKDYIGAFVIVGERFDADLARSFDSRECYLLSRPFDNGNLDRLLEELENRPESTAARSR